MQTITKAKISRTNLMEYIHEDRDFLMGLQDDLSDMLYATGRYTITIDDKREEYLDSLSEGKDFDDDYGSKVDALVDTMGVTDEKESTVHRRKDLDSL